MAIAFISQGQRLRQFHLACVALSWACTACCGVVESRAAPPPAVDISGRAALREPVALCCLGERVLCANQRSGVSLLDAKTRRVLAEAQVGSAALADMASLDESSALVCGHDRGLDVVRVGAGPGLVRRRVATLPHRPARMVVAAERDASGRRLVCTTSESGRAVMVTKAPLSGPGQAITRVVTLDFSPRSLLLLTDRLLLVADGYGGELALLDLARRQVVRTWEMPWHNVGGLALSPRGDVLVTHQQLDRGWGDRDGVHWGVFLDNRLSGISAASLRAGEDAGTLLGSAWTERLGLVGSAAGDPGEVVVDEEGAMVVALAGIDAVLISAASYRKQAPAGDLPSAICRVGEELWVANQLDDTISVFDASTGNPLETIALGPRPALSGVERGRRLFFDARLSHDGWMSCHSCHTRGHTSGGFADTLGDGGYGAPKRIPSLRGAAETGPWGWNGTADSLVAQVRKSVRTTMHGRPLAAGQGRDLVAFLTSLSSPRRPTRPSKPTHSTRPRAPSAAATNPRQAAAIRRGRDVFRREGCAACHAPPSYTSAAVYDVGVKDESGETKFNPPSLRGVGERQRLFHDGRFELPELIRQAKHQLPAPLPDEDADALIAFLRSL